MGWFTVPTMIRFLNAFYLFLAAITVFSSAAKANEADHNLQGSWVMKCDRGLQKQQQFIENQTITTEFFHQDRECLKESFRFKTTGLFELNPEHLDWMDFKYQQIELTLFIPAVAQDFNSRAVCGFTNWKAGEPQTITGLPCALFSYNKPTQIPKAGDQKFGIYKIENNKLFFGQLTKETDGSTEQKRPMMFSPDAFEKELN